jgi:hypothetical protein
MTENPTESQRIPAESQGIPLMVEIVVTVDHVYLPLDEENNAVADWAVTSVSTTRVSRRARLQVPADLAKHLSERDQAEILSAPLPSAALGTGKAGI